MYATDEYRAERMEGMEIQSFRGPKRFNTKREMWAVTVAKMYLRSLRTGQVPNYPSEPVEGARSQIFVPKPSGCRK